MNYLVIMPKLLQNPMEFHIQKTGYLYLMPLGILYISSNLKHSGKNVYTLNLNLSSSGIEDAVSDSILRNNIDVVCVGGLSTEYAQIKTIVSHAKTLNEKITAIIGGGLVTAAPEIILNGIENADIGIIGEGDHSIVEVADALEKASDLDNIKGIVFKKNGKIIKTAERKDIQDLDSLPFPDYEGFGYDPKKNYFYDAVCICTSRSCPFNCSFCFHTCGRTYRERSLDNVFAEIDFLVKRYDISGLYILDELFSLDKVRVEEFCDRIEPYKLNWMCQTRVESVDYNTLRKLKKSGCSILGMGIESASDKILRSMNKKSTISQIDRALEIAKSAGVVLSGNLLFGDKDDDLVSFHENLRWLDAHPDHRISNFFPIWILPGSPLYRYALENGHIKDEIAYLENGQYHINVTRLNDADFKECHSIMFHAITCREYPAKDITVHGLIKEERGVLATCKCPVCGAELRHNARDFFGLEILVCRKCSLRSNINLFNIFGDIIKNALKEVLRDRKVILWGIGNVGRKFAMYCEPVLNDNFHLIDKTPFIQGKNFGGKTVVAPESIGFDAAYVLIGASVRNWLAESVCASNIMTIESIKKEAALLPVHIGTMMEVNAYAFNAVAESGQYRFL